jgi:hypothetical protein
LGKKEVANGKHSLLATRRTEPGAQGCRPCSCGCDTRQGVAGVGYLTGSDPDGNGFTVWIKDEAMYQRVAKSLR